MRQICGSETRKDRRGRRKEGERGRGGGRKEGKEGRRDGGGEMGEEEEVKNVIPQGRRDRRPCLPDRSRKVQNLQGPFQHRR